MYREKNSKGLMIVIGALSLIIIISIAYAAFTGQLNITGTAVGRDSKWDIHFESVSSITTTGTAKVLSNHQPAINPNNRTQIQDYEVSLTSPNDSISFTFDVVNDGNYNASISDIDVGTPECTSTDSDSATNMCNNLTYTLRYANGAIINTSDVLYAKDKLSFKVTLQFNDISNPDLLPSAEVSIGNLGIEIDFEQLGGAGVNDDGTVANNRVYHIGDKITLNNEDYWVIEDSGAGQDYVVALKDLSLTATEVNTYGSSIPVTAGNSNGYSGGVHYGQSTDYGSSYIKVILEQWILDKFQVDDLKEINNYKVRLVTANEYNSKLSVYSWSRYNNYSYWTMTSNGGSNYVYMITKNGLDQYGGINIQRHAVRPVINVYKSALETNNNN